jgi:hypothetical protein
MKHLLRTGLTLIVNDGVQCDDDNHRWIYIEKYVGYSGTFVEIDELIEEDGQIYAGLILDHDQKFDEVDELLDSWIECYDCNKRAPWRDWDVR